MKMMTKTCTIYNCTRGIYLGQLETINELLAQIGKQEVQSFPFAHDRIVYLECPRINNEFDSKIK